MAKLLDGLTVIDFTHALSGPFCTATLADLGCRVIKIEAPGAGDGFRRLGPFINGSSAYFSGVNRGKESLTVNLKHPEGIQIIEALVQKADIVVENYRPGVMKSFGLTYERLSTVNPRIVYLSVSGFGQEGPYSHLGAFDIVVQAMSGIMSVTGKEDGEPTRVGVSVGDLIPALYGVSSILAALYRREQTGKGCYIDLSMLDCLVSVAENAIARYWATGEVPGPIGNRHPVITPFSTYTASDGYIVIAVGGDAQWRDMCEAVARPDLSCHADYETNELRTKNVKQVTELLNEVFSGKTVAEWLKVLQEAEVPCAKVNTIKDVFHDPHIRYRNMIQGIQQPLMGLQEVPGTPIKARGFDDSINKPSPELGEHTEKVLRELLALPEEEINRLFVEGIV